MPRRRFPCPACHGEASGTDPAPWTCDGCGGSGDHVVCEQQLVEVLTDVSFEVLSIAAKERARNCASILILDDVDPDDPAFEQLIVTMLGRARLPHLGAVPVTDDELGEVARRIAAYVRGEDLHPRPVKPGEGRRETRAAPSQVASLPSSLRPEPSAPSREALATEPGREEGHGAPPLAVADAGPAPLSTAPVPLDELQRRARCAAAGWMGPFGGRR